MGRHHQSRREVRARGVLFLIAGLLAAAGLSGVWWCSRPVLSPKSESAARPSQSAAPAAAHSATATGPAPVVPTMTQIDDIARRLGQSTDPTENRRLLARLRTLLDALPPAVAARTVRTLLGSKMDADTHLDLTVRPGGMLGDASSLRVFLLDYLGPIDRAGAADVGREILTSPTSPDEWAVSLRNVARADASAGTRSYLTGKMREMISNPSWRQNPTAGFLQAFDVIVHIRGMELTPQLAELVRDRQNRAVAHAAFLTLDRLTLADPAAALGRLAAQPELMAGWEETRANLFARADVRDQPQMELLESYLLDARRSPRELDAFAGLYPSANYMISNNLLTDSQPPARAELILRDRAALAAVEAWTADPRFIGLQASLGMIRERLRTFVEQAAQLPEK